MKNNYLNIYKPKIINLKKAKKHIENNNVIGLPTETVYGLAANAYSNKSVKKSCVRSHFGNRDSDHTHTHPATVSPGRRSVVSHLWISSE